MSHTEIQSRSFSSGLDGLKRALIVGADSTVGRGLFDTLTRNGVAVWGTSRRDAAQGLLRLDLSRPPTTWMLPEPQVEVAFLCAAVTSQAQCASAPEATHAINVLQTLKLAKALVDAGTFVIFISTNLVLDGRVPYATTAEPVNPQTIYGRQKAEAEQRLLALGERVAIVRFGKIVAPGLPLFQGWADALRAGKSIFPFSDMIMAPVALSFAIEVLCRVALSQTGGIVQASAASDITYADAARVIAAHAGVADALVVPVSRPCAEQSASPSYSTFDAGGVIALGLQAPAPALAFDHFSTMHVAASRA